MVANSTQYSIADIHFYFVVQYMSLFNGEDDVITKYLCCVQVTLFLDLIVFFFKWSRRASEITCVCECAICLCLWRKCPERSTYVVHVIKGLFTCHPCFMVIQVLPGITVGNAGHGVKTILLKCAWDKLHVVYETKQNHGMRHVVVSQTQWYHTCHQMLFQITVNYYVDQARPHHSNTCWSIRYLA